MLDLHQKPTGTQYTPTVSLLVVAFVFSPAVLIASHPLGYLSVSLAFACSALCVALAWVHLKKRSQLTIPSLETPPDTRSKFRSRASRVAIVCAIFSTPLLYAADFSSYRGFQFGSKLATAAQEAGLKASDARLIHQRPAVIQELNWRPGSPFQTSATGVDPVREGLLRFYNGELFQIAITYDREKVKGMTEADMVEAISLTYGTATRPAVEIPYQSNYGDVATVIARWEVPEFSYDLVRTGDKSSFALILTLKSLDASARAAITEARRLDTLEAPQRAIALEKQQEAENRHMLDKARSANLPNFRP